MRDAVVVVPNWNGSPLLSAYLPSLLTQGARVAVVDNGSGDDSAQVARALGAEVVALPRNLGFAAAVNRGIQATSEPWVAIVNNDVRLAPDWLVRLRAAMEETGAALGTGRIWSEARPGLLDGAYDVLSRGATAWRAGHGGKGEAFGARRMARMVSLTAALVRREAFERVGLLDEDFESYLEDVEFSLRCARVGLDAVYEPAAEAWHRGSATLGAWHPETTRRIARNQVMLIAKHYPQGWIWRYGRAVLAGQALWGAVAWKHGAGAAFLKGKWQGWRGYSDWRARSKWVDREDALEAVLAEGDAEIRRLAADSYWRWYLRLSGGK